jgi:amidohydrolase
MHPLLQRATAFEAELVDVRRDLHRHPELAFQEHRTAELVASRAERLGYAVRRGVGRTGVVAELSHGTGPIVALRADMDALPIQEENDVSYRSTVPGVMHACGHDGHTAMLLGAARLLAEAHQRGELPAGTVRLLFQPSEESSDEENRSGAARMVEDGAMAGVAAVFGLHVGGHLSSGRVFLRGGAIMAGSDTLRITVTGRSAHAARPHEGVDALVLAAQVVLACQHAVARRISPLSAGVLTLGRIRGGVAENVLADRVEIHGTLRYFQEDVRRALQAAARAAVAVADALGGAGELEIRTGYPPVVNDDAMTGILRGAAAATLGEETIAEFEPMMGAEDFALLLRQAPGAFAWIGAALGDGREHHHPAFDIDESVLPRGAALLAACALHALRHAPLAAAAP